MSNIINTNLSNLLHIKCVEHYRKNEIYDIDNLADITITRIINQYNNDWDNSIASRFQTGC